jgi:hypothetical protein
MFTYLYHIPGLNFVADALYLVGTTFAIITGLMVSENLYTQAGIQLAEETN